MRRLRYGIQHRAYSILRVFKCALAGGASTSIGNLTALRAASTNSTAQLDSRRHRGGPHAPHVSAADQAVEFLHAVHRSATSARSSCTCVACRAVEHSGRVWKLNTRIPRSPRHTQHLRSCSSALNLPILQRGPPVPTSTGSNLVPTQPRTSIPSHAHTSSAGKLAWENKSATRDGV